MELIHTSNSHFREMVQGTAIISDGWLVTRWECDRGRMDRGMDGWMEE
jgi:hypothetical protein